MKSNKISFKEQILQNIKNRSNITFGYLNLPRDLQVLSLEPNTKVSFDIIPYVVKDENHLDRDDEFDIAIPGNLWYKKPFRTHRFVGIDRKNNVVVCPTTVRKRCPICEYRQKRIKEGASKEEINSLKYSLRNLYLVYYEQKICLLDIAEYLFQEALSKEIKDNPEYASFADLKEGYTLKLRIDSKSIGGGKPFAEVGRIDFIERKYDLSKLINVKELPSLDDLLIIYDYDTLNKMFFETLDDEVIEEEAIQVKDDNLESPAQTIQRKDENIVTIYPPSKNSEEIEKKKCPYGHEFGKDVDKYEECIDCDEWNLCYSNLKNK